MLSRTEFVDYVETSLREWYNAKEGHHYEPFDGAAMVEDLEAQFPELFPWENNQKC